MLTIRLSRVGKKNKPMYRLIISEKARDPYGRFLEILGSYNPYTKKLLAKADRIKHWLEKGAGMSATVNNLLIEKGVIEGKKVKASKIRKKKKGEKPKDVSAEKDTKEVPEKNKEKFSEKEEKKEAKESASAKAMADKSASASVDVKAMADKSASAPVTEDKEAKPEDAPKGSQGDKSQPALEKSSESEPKKEDKKE